MKLSKLIFKDNDQSMFKNQKIRIFLLIFTVIGIIIALYLANPKIYNTALYCAGPDNCSIVNSSRYATIAGAPNAVIGLGAYIVIFAIINLEDKYKFIKNNSPLFYFSHCDVVVVYSGFHQSVHTSKFLKPYAEVEKCHEFVAITSIVYY